MNFNKVITAVLCFSSGVKIGHADWKDDIDYTKLAAEYGDQLRSDVDVGVGMAEAGSNYSPNASDSKFANVTFNLRSGSSDNSGHASSVASRIAGTGSILPGLTQLDVFQSSNWLSTYPNFLSTGPVDPEIDIVNHSWISTSAGAAAFTLQRSDYIIDVFDCLMVAGLNNNDSFPQLMGNMYNGITVGNTNGNHSKGGTNTDGSGRIKPDILGTNTATSYGTPVVTATATLVLNEAKGLGYDVVGNTEMLKALVLVGATKEEVSDWSHSSTKPLDEVFGLGEVNVYNSYRTLISGRVEASESDASNGSGWDFGTTVAQPNQYLIYHSGGTFSAVLTWHRVVDKGSSWFFMTTDLADLSMGLYQSDAGGVRGTEVFLSDSPVDNVEHVYEEGLAAGYYLIEIDGDQSDVSYGLAWRDEFTDTQVEDPEENVAVSFVGISNGEILTYGVEKAFQASVEGAVSDIEKVELFSGETLVHTESSSPYAFSITPDSLQNIDLELRVTTGIGVYTSSLSATVADGDLSLSLAGASADSEFTTGDVLSLSAEIDGTYHSVQSVSFRVNGNEIFNDLAAPFEMSWNPVLAGSYSLQVIALNGSGESFESEAVSVSLVDPIPDPVALSLSLSEASIELGEEVTLSATILGSEADLSSVEFYLGEVLIGSDSNAPYAITWVSESSGSFDFTARSVNTASLTASSGIASVVVEDPIPDAVAISLSVSSEEIETGSTTSLIAVPIGDAEALARVDFYLGETLIGSDSEAPYSIDWVSETAGSFGFTAKSVNTASLIASSGLATVVVSDPIPEAVAISLSVSNEEIETGNATLLTATPIGDGEFLARVDFYLGETLIGSDAVAPYSATWVSEGPGSFDFIARSVNTASLTATSETVMVVVSDPIPDAVAIDLSIGSAEIETGEWVSLTAAPIGDVESLVRVDFYLGETLLGSDSTSPYAIEWLGSEAGSYDFSARSVNSANLIYDSNVESLIVSDPILERDVIFVEITGLENRDYRVGESADIRVLVEGNLSPISQVSLFEGDELIKVESYATYDFPWSVGNVGLRTLKAVVETALGSYEKEALVDVLDASLDPAVEIQGGSLAREVGETVSIEVFDTQGDGTVDSVEFSVNGSPLGELLEAPFVWKWTPALSGSYSIATKSKNLS
ncbi:MAG: Ig-like domain-containing protein, partial [Verrucomicrobiota bacterium]